METSGSDAAVTYLGKAEERDGYGELEHLPPLLEDEENVSLADILSLRDSCLSEEEVWAVCAECVVALQSIRPSHLFHTLCITPDTLAFNAHGNVCFMEQLSDDPEGSFVPPEFDNTGSTFEGHVYSLGSTLSAALNFVIEPELEAELGVEIQRLLERMQEEKPEDRPLLQDILSLAETRLSHTSSAAVCRKLSSIGRRVLSIESVATFQDGQEGSWEARWQHPKPRCLLKRLSSDDNTKDLCVDSSYKANGLSRQQVCTGWDSSLWAEDMDSGDRDCMILTDELDCRSHNSSPVRRRAQQRLNRVRGALNRSCSVPDSNNPPCLSPPTHGDISIPVSDLTEIGADEHLGCKSSWSNRLQRLNRGRSCDSYPRSLEEDCMNSLADNQMLQINEDVAEFLCSGETNIQECQDDECKDCNQDLASPYTSYQELDMEHDSFGDLSSLNHGLYIPNNHMTKSMLCLNEESQDEWISLRELLTRCGRRLTVNELWALCYTCLSSLQTYIDFPAYLCLDTVYVGCEGEVLFLKPKNIGHRDEFYLAPEYQEHGIVTEKVCVYGVAAILWATAKFNLSPNQKLAMPRKLKRLLLEMAKRTPIERPTIVMAKKSCRDYLSRQGTDAETVWNELLSRVHPPASKSTDGEDLSADDPHQTSYEESAQINSGFVPMATESRLAPVPGPVPHSYPVHKELQFPEAFTSTATHFTPIILTNEEDSEEESQNLGAAIEETVEEFNKSSEHIEERSLDLDFTAHSEDPYPTQTEPSLPTEEWDPVNQVVMNKTLPVNSVSTLPNTSCLEVSLPPPLSSNLNSCGVFNNYLFRQDPKTGHLSLVPVQVRAPESVLGLDINLSLVLQSLQGLITVPESTDGPLINCQTVPERPEPQQYDPSSSYFNGSSISSDSPLEHSVPGAYNGQINEGTRGENQSPSGSNFPKVHPALQEVIDLLKGEFSLDGCLDNGHEDIAMGECIFSLKDLQYCVFASVVRERFSDLYWEDDLLGVLHRLVNYSSTALASNEQPPSKAVKRAANTPPLIATAWRGKREVCPHGCLDLNGNIHTASCAAADTWEGSKARSCDGENEAALEEFDLRSEESENCICEGASTDRDSSDAGVMMEGGDHSAGGSDESPSEAEFLSGKEGLPGARDEQMSPGCSEDMEDSDSLVSERFLPGSRAEGPGLICSPAWALAFFGEDCFSPEVIQYAVKLGQHTGSPCLDVKTQELQQQLIIETRNLKKTRNFYQKLIQQERKNKGSESKLMLSKLKTQLEELRSKVAFLDCVKKYLEILCVDQWGLEVSLLPSLAAYGPGPLNLQSSEDPSVLSFGGNKGKKTLQAATPLGLMAYLYARNAAVEGYIQQFLYTYRFFCTPEQFLQFIMDKFISATREGPDMSEDGVKIFHRSLDLLQFWITDCKAVDFTPKSSFVDTLENFINTEVIPVDSRGQALLAALRSPLSMTWSKGGGSQISFEEEDGSVDVHSSTEDLGRKWRISRVVEPSPSMSKEKAFSIAAALPIPCYGSLVDDLSNVCLHSEERLPFSQNEYSAQHVAQQLTLLQQDIFQGCHPVHLLNSRTQGIRDNVLNPNKNVSQHIPPAEGSGVLVTEGTPSDSYLQQLLTYSDSVTNWISGEIVICDSVKTQVALLTKYLWIGKHCYESRNFATAMQVLGGLENVIVRQLPAWKHLSSKVSEILEELRAVQVFLKSDDLCLMGGEQAKRRPTLPSVHILAMHIQQREIGAFTLTTGACKWTKLRSIAKLVSQVHAFQEVAYPYSPDRDLQVYLQRRVARLSTSDIHLLAASNDSNFQQSTERQTHRIQNTLRRVKATFQ